MKKLILQLIIISVAIMPFQHVQAAKTIGVSAKSAVLMEQKSGRVLYQKYPNTKRKIASITKIMTAILAIESGKLDQEILITPDMLKTEGSSIYLQAGEKITLRDLVYGLILRSGNDAALAIAISVGGSVPGFVYLMNEKANIIGMKNTNFTNPSGLDDKDKHVSTAYDMALLTRYAMENPDFQKVFATKFYRTTTSKGEVRVWKNKNKMLTKYYKYSTGGKTGFTKKAGRTLVSTAKKNGMDLIAVTISAPSDWKDHQYMFNLSYKNYKLHDFVKKGYIEGITNKTYKNHLRINSDLDYPISFNEIDNFKVKYVLFPPKKFSKNKPKDKSLVGRVYLYSGIELVLSKPIFYTKKIYKKPFLKSLQGMFTSFMDVSRNG